MKSTNVIFDKVNNNEVVKLNIGIGRKKFGDGFIGVDINKGRLTDVVSDITKLSEIIPEGSIDEIYSRHTIEHFGRKEVPDILKSWINLLKDGGKITLNFPDLDKYVEFYINHRKKIGIEEFSRLLYGSQRDKYDLHKVGLNSKYISDIFKKNNVRTVLVSSAPVFLDIGETMIGTEVTGIKNES
jgi:predicted SAM-dependent methyltransferase